MKETIFTDEKEALRQISLNESYINDVNATLEEIAEALDMPLNDDDVNALLAIAYAPILEKKRQQVRKYVASLPKMAFDRDSIEANAMQEAEAMLKRKVRRFVTPYGLGERLYFVQDARLCMLPDASERAFAKYSKYIINDQERKIWEAMQGAVSSLNTLQGAINDYVQSDMVAVSVSDAMHSLDAALYTSNDFKREPRLNCGIFDLLRAHNAKKPRA